MAMTPFLILGTILGLAAGFVMHRSDFCLAGTFRDLFLFRSLFKLRILLLLIITSMILFEFARLAGLLIYPFPLLYSPSSSEPTTVTAPTRFPKQPGMGLKVDVRKDDRCYSILIYKG